MSDLIEREVDKFLEVPPLKSNYNNCPKVTSEMVMDSFNEAKRKLSPIWDIRDYVAVNPYFGFKDKNILETSKYMRSISGRDIFPKLDYFLKKYDSGEITPYDLEVAKKLHLLENNESSVKDVSVEELVSFLSSPKGEGQVNRIRSLSDLYDLEKNDNASELITNEISKWASAYFDEGQAFWKIDTKGMSFYSWWRSLVKFDSPFGGKSNKFSNIIKSLPREADHALRVLTEMILARTSLSQSELTDYYYRLIYSILGWSSYIQKFEFEASRSSDNTTKLKKVGGLVDIITIRLAYDVALIDEISELTIVDDENVSNMYDSEIDYTYIWLNAAENSYRRSIEKKIVESDYSITEQSRADVQMAFCIDVRSEILRRHLENTSQKIQTIGFAGFFGMPISLKELGHHEADQNCPILLNPAYEVGESALKNEEVLIDKKFKFVDSQYFKKSVQSSANSGFSFVETCGFGYIGKILKCGLGNKKPNLDLKLMGLSPQEKEEVHLNFEHLKIEDRINLAYKALKNMGLTKNFAKYVFFFGHGSESSNNPYASALDCGACAGHNGKGNAKLIASLLNDKNIQNELQNKGINIPEDTIFISGWHNTVKDELIIDRDKSIELSDKQSEELDFYYGLFEKASVNCQKERSKRLPGFEGLNDNELKEELSRKANDWSEVRPEWGLARNTSFIVARRDLTRSLDLDGRAFLHDYDFSMDKDLSVLELIMTAPMIVTNWINMQYYASTVNPEKFGAGNKVLSNVVGGIGCIQGNEGDLLGGLTLQSVFYNGEYFHEPLRLQVFIEAETSAIEKIINKHQLVKDLISNHWLKVISINSKKNEFKLYQNSRWIHIKEELWN